MSHTATAGACVALGHCEFCGVRHTFGGELSHSLLFRPGIVSEDPVKRAADIVRGPDERVVSSDSLICVALRFNSKQPHGAADTNFSNLSKESKTL